jgi:hypothetical protein
VYYLGFIRKTAMFGVIAVFLSSMMFGAGPAWLRVSQLTH